MRRMIILLIGISIVGVALILFNTTHTPFRTWAWQGISRVQNILQTMGLSASSSEQDRDQLQSEVVRLRAEYHVTQFIQKQVGMTSLESSTVTNALVIGRPIDAFRSQLIINKGAQDGIQVGKPVVINQSTLVGIITEVHASYAVCTLLFHPDVALAAGITRDEEAPIAGIVEGDRYTALFLTTLPKDRNVSVGDDVVSLPSQHDIPPGLFIGTVSSVYAEEQDVYQRALLSLPYDVNDIFAVSILMESS